MRTTIQQLLETISDIEVSAEVPDDILEKGVTYFSFSFNENYINSDMDNNYTNQVNMIGYVKRLINSSENTQLIIDTASDLIIDKLKELNIRCSSEDVSIENNVKKIRIIGKGTYNEINNILY